AHGHAAAGESEVVRKERSVDEGRVPGNRGSRAAESGGVPGAGLTKGSERLAISSARQRDASDFARHRTTAIARPALARSLGAAAGCMELETISQDQRG